MEIQVKQAVGEADEDEENETGLEGLPPEEALEKEIENYRSADVARIHLEIHQIDLAQNQKIQGVKISEIQFAEIEKYFEKLQKVVERKNLLDKKANGIRKRFSKVVEVLRKKKVFK
jgi:hypothetical protein